MSPLKITITVSLLFILLFGYIVLRSQGMGEIAYPQAILSIPKKSFSALEPVIIKIDLKTLGFYPDGLPDIIGKAHAVSDGPITVTVVNPTGEVTEEIPVEITKEGESIYMVKAVLPLSFEPGKYTMSVVLSDGLARREITQDFTWGVLAINTNKSTYSPGETARLFIAVLNEEGNMVCDADVSLVITDPNGQKNTMTSKANNIKVNPACFLKDFTMEPDYETRYTTEGPGWYTMELTAKTGNGTYSITDSFLVMEDAPFDVERVTATRIFPPARYPMTLDITANRDFAGSVQMIIPDDFQIWPLENVEEYDDVSITTLTDDSYTEKVKSLLWNIDVKKGDVIRLGYEYKTPPKSPEFYLLGPFSFYEGGDLTKEPVFQASRRWQLAIDADGSGTNVVNPTTGVTSATGQTYTFTFTAAEQMDSGYVSTVIPAGWSEPQIFNGQPGFTLVTAGSGAAIASPSSELGGEGTFSGGTLTEGAGIWEENPSQLDTCGNTTQQNLAADTTNFKQGSQSVQCNNTGVTTPDNGDSFGYVYNSTQNMTPYETFGLWFRSTVAITANSTLAIVFYTGTLTTAATGGSFDVRSSLNGGANLNANTWYFLSGSVTGVTRTAIKSWGVQALSDTGLDSKSISVDDFLLGDTTPVFPTITGTGPWTITTRLLDLDNTETIVLTYGSGGGSSGVTNSATGGVHTFTTQSQLSAIGTLTNISSQPIVTLSTPTPTPTPTPGDFNFEGLQMEGLNIN